MCKFYTFKTPKCWNLACNILKIPDVPWYSRFLKGYIFIIESNNSIWKCPGNTFFDIISLRTIKQTKKELLNNLQSFMG